MPTENLTFEPDEIYKEVRERAEAEGAYTHEEWKAIVEAVIQDKTEFAEVDDEDLEELRENLVNRFNDFEAEERGGQQ